MSVRRRCCWRAVTLALSVTTWRHVSRLARKPSQAPGTASTATTTVAAPPDAGRARRLGPVQPRPPFAGPAPRVLFAVSVVLAVAAVLVHWPENKSTYGLGWLLMGAALVPLVWSLVTARGADAGGTPHHLAADGPPDDRADSARRATGLRTAASATVWAVGAVLAYLSLRTVRVDADDVFYVNKAVYVAETGRIPLRYTIYSDQVLPALRGAGTASLQSIEVLQGAVAHLLGISAGTVVYLVTPPVMSFLAVWAGGGLPAAGPWCGPWWPSRWRRPTCCGGSRAATGSAPSGSGGSGRARSSSSAWPCRCSTSP